MKNVRSPFFKYVPRWYVFDILAIVVIVLGYMAGLRPLLDVESDAEVLGYSILALAVANILSMLHTGTVHRKVTYNIAGWRKPAFVEVTMTANSIWEFVGLCISIGVGVSLADMFLFSDFFWIVSVYLFTRTFHLFNQYFGCLLYIHLFVYTPDEDVLDGEIEWEEMSG